MGWFIAIPLVLGIVTYHIHRHPEHWSPTPMPETIGWTLLWAGLGVVPAAGIAAFLSILLPHEEEITGQLEIVALADATHTDGEFYLFGGNIESEPVYRYYYDTGAGYRMGWKPVEDSLIVESETETPRYDKIEDVRDASLFNLKMTHDTRYIFYVPPGTVTNTFDLDLEG